MSDNKWADQNTAIIEEFRANDGVVGGYFSGVPLALVHHTGARSGVERVAPLASQELDEGSGWAVFASKGGADDNPAWYYNLLANPETTVEVPPVAAVEVPEPTPAPPKRRPPKPPPEIAGTFEAPLDHFRNPATHWIEDWRHRGRTHQVDFYRFEDHVIWGLTAAILRQFIEITTLLR